MAGVGGASGSTGLASRCSKWGMRLPSVTSNPGRGSLVALERLWSRLSPHRSASEIAGVAVDAVRSRRELIIENAVLRHQVNVLRRRSRRSKLNLVDRLKLLIGARLLPSWRRAIGHRPAGDRPALASCRLPPVLAAPIPPAEDVAAAPRDDRPKWGRAGADHLLTELFPCPRPLQIRGHMTLASTSRDPNMKANGCLDAPRFSGRSGTLRAPCRAWRSPMASRSGQPLEKSSIS